METVIAQLVRSLDADSSEVAEEAQYSLIDLGPQVLDQLIEAAPHLTPFGQLCAVEVFSALGDPRPEDALVAMLSSDGPVVRQWAAEALGEIGIQHAVPALRQAYENFRRSGEDLTHSEAMALRRALTELGARTVVLPPGAAALRRQVDHLDPAWPAARLAEVIEELAAHGQATLCFQIWRIEDGKAYHRPGSDIDWAVDRQKPWPRIVAECRDWALLAADATDQEDPDLVATVCWIAAEDL